MKFLIDADCPYSLVEVFKRHKHFALHVRDVSLGSASDDEIFEYANKNGLIVVTRDLGFAEKFIEDKGVGLLLIRLPYFFTSVKIIAVLDEFLKEIDASNLTNSITILELDRYRFKKLQ